MIHSQIRPHSLHLHHRLAPPNLLGGVVGAVFVTERGKKKILLLSLYCHLQRQMNRVESVKASYRGPTGFMLYVVGSRNTRNPLSGCVLIQFVGFLDNSLVSSRVYRKGSCEALKDVVTVDSAKLCY